MNKSEVVELLKTIKRAYTGVDVSAESIDHYCKFLNDVPYEFAIQNVEEHIRTNRFPPVIAEIRGKYAEMVESDRMKRLSQEHLANLETWRSNPAEPPSEYWEIVKSKIRGNA